MNRLSLILFVSIFVLLFTGCSSDSPRDVVEKSLKCRMKNDVKGFASCIYFPGGEDGRKYYIERREKLLNQHPDRVRTVENFEILDEDVDDSKGQAKVTVRIKLSGSDYNYNVEWPIELVRNKNRWWIASYDHIALNIFTI